ncbi:MAG: transposase [Methylocystis sp.]|nr:transposase [Alphaproteobacteria bacterium]
MLSAILLAHRRPSGSLKGETVARCFSSLIDGCVNGVIADAILVGPPDHFLAKIADEAGCAFAENLDPAAGFREAVEQARYERLLILSAEFGLERGLIDELRDLLNFGDPADSYSLHVEPDTLVTRLFPNLAKTAGLITTRELVKKHIHIVQPNDLAKKLRRKSLTSRARRL